MARCAYIKPGGERCGAAAMRGYETCYGHRPDLAAERQRNASRGGKSGGRGRGGSGETAEIRALLKDLTAGVLEHRINTGTAAVVTQLLNARIRLVEVDRKVHETDVLEVKLRELEESITGQTGGRQWGA
jgi:hypothetical protein